MLPWHQQMLADVTEAQMGVLIFQPLPEAPDLTTIPSMEEQAGRVLPLDL